MESSCDYVSIRGIAQNCDVHPKEIWSDSMVFEEEDYENIKENDTVFVITSTLNQFCEIVLPKLGDTKIKLVTGACVRGVPNEISELYSMNFLELFKNNVTHWFTQNFDGTDECIPIPLGIDYHTLLRGDHYWGHQAIALEQEEKLKNFYSDFETKKEKTFSCFHFMKFERHDRDRYKAIEHLSNVKFNDVLKNPINRNSLWKVMSSYKFIISPHGNGLDCHRTYEAMLLGSIPIVRSSTLDSLYKDMPIIILENWEDLTEETLSNYVYSGSLEKLNLKYWVELIKNAV